MRLPDRLLGVSLYPGAKPNAGLCHCVTRNEHLWPTTTTTGGRHRSPRDRQPAVFYAPTLDVDDATKDAFYMDVQRAMNEIPRHCRHKECTEPLVIGKKIFGTFGEDSRSWMGALPGSPIFGEQGWGLTRW